MSGFYNPRRSRNLFEPGKPYKLSRSKLDLFLKCPRCFYLDRRIGIGQPPGPPFSLNSAVDKLLKKEFDGYRALGRPHPIMELHGIRAVPFAHEKLEVWRDALRAGITYYDETTFLTISGGIDDVWINDARELHIVDYKATAKDGEVNIDADWQKSYKRQMEMYQWLFIKNGFSVSSIGYFLYCNGRTDREAFNGRLEFDLKLIPYKGDVSWVEGALEEAFDCLMQESFPEAAPDCDFCLYSSAILQAGTAKLLPRPPG